MGLPREVEDTRLSSRQPHQAQLGARASSVRDIKWHSFRTRKASWAARRSSIGYGICTWMSARLDHVLLYSRLTTRDSRMQRPDVGRASYVESHVRSGSYTLPIDLRLTLPKSDFEPVRLRVKRIGASRLTLLCCCATHAWWRGGDDRLMRPPRSRRCFD
ncbi:hypothetical protein IE81DRAFT_81312 [Ceraceosorus guamensis]|uniref:Uncharacterized protein n=1 Tax=Ceraceosorus guamensis TaxID=1522189 RepID=A0A316WE24_9BASI|nr:hypothetical protein IE81DRAFT_81312 [Ceraceosorus guamensis]PWN46043.1 hypothetical protein IE81DRAFT_81312 [Ceraceosorus guamensis]